MRHWNLVVGALIAGQLGLAVFAAEKPPADYQKAMKDLGAFASGIDKAINDEDYETVTKLALSAADAFAVAEKYWNDKKDEKAAQMASTGGKAAADLNVVSTTFKSKEGAAYSAKAVTETCEGCHSLHRQALGDGSFEIK
jgi:cytochrome c556